MAPVDMQTIAAPEWAAARENPTVPAPSPSRTRRACPSSTTLRSYCLLPRLHSNIVKARIVKSESEIGRLMRLNHRPRLRAHLWIHTGGSRAAAEG